MDKNNYTIKEVEKVVDIFSEYNNIRDAYEYYKGLKNFLDNSDLKQLDPKLYSDYYNYLIRLKFLVLNFFDDWEDIEELLKNHFEVIYKIKYYDLWSKIKLNLLIIPDLNKRDEIKSILKNVLLACSRKIIDSEKYKEVEGLPTTVMEWLKDFIVNLGIDKIDHLKKVQYLTNSKNVIKLDESDKGKLKILFDLYEKLGLSSNTPDGFENDVPMVINGKNIIYTQGQAEEISPKVMDLIKSIKISSEEPIIKAEGEEIEDINKLKEIANKYPPGSLERKGIEEEIRKLEVRSEK